MQKQQLTGATDPEEAISDADPAAVEDALARIMASDSFRASERLRQFLTYVVRESLEMRAARIKAYTIATEVFGRGADFDPGTDPIVRIEAARLRRALDHYYLTAGTNDPLVIRIPKGGYAPTFQENVVTTAVSATPSIDASVAVLSLSNLTGDSGQDYFAAGMTEELHSALGQYSSVRTVAINSIDNEQALADTVDQKLASFALLGSVRKADDTVRVTVRLIDCSTRAQVWARTYDRTLSSKNLIEVQDDIAHDVVVNVAEHYGGAIPGSLARKSRTVETDSLTAYDATLHLHYYYNPGWDESIWQETRTSLELAHEKEPDNVSVQIALAEVLHDGWSCGVANEAQADKDRAEKLIQSVLSQNPENDYALFVYGLLCCGNRDRANLKKAGRRLLGLSDDLSMNLLGGWMLVVAGEYALGEAIVRKSTEQLSTFPRWAHHALMLCHLVKGEYEEALAEAEAFDMPGLLWSQLDRAIALSFLELHEEAGRAYSATCEVQTDVAERPQPYISRYILDDKLVEEIMARLNASQLLSSSGQTK